MNRLSDLLGIELPIIQAPMAGVQGSALAIAVATRAAWARCRARCSARRDARGARGDPGADDAGRSTSTSSATRRLTPDAAREAAWRAALAPYFDEFGIDPAPSRRARRGQPFSAEAADVLGAFARRW